MKNSENDQLMKEIMQLRHKVAELEENRAALNSSDKKDETTDLKLNDAIQQLQANEQQLMASNQQLQANEQQLRAANQQLQASEQQLMASNQQLRALNQQLAANEKELERSKHTAEHYLNLAAGIILSLDVDGNITLLNESGHQLLGYENGTLIGRNWFETCLPKHNIEELKLVFKQTMSNAFDNVAYYESCIQTKDGTIKTLFWHNTILEDDNGSAIGVLCSGEDITERLKAEQRIVESEEKFKTLYNKAPLAYQSLNEDGCLIDINPMWQKTLGYKREEVIGKWFGDFLDPDYVDHFRKNFPEFKRRGCVSDVQFQMRKKDGTNIYVSFEGCVGYTPEGKFKQTYCVFQNITQRKKAEDALLHSEENLKKTFSLSPSIIGKANLLTGYFVEANQAVTKILGYSVEEFITTPFVELIHPDDLKRSEKEKNEQVKGKEVTYFENRYRCKDGTYKWLAWYGTKADEEGIVRAVGSDISAQKQSSIELDAIFNTAADGMRLIGLDYKIKKANATFFEMVGLPREEVIGKYCYDVFSGEYCNSEACPLAILQKDTNLKLRKEIEKKRPDGKIIPTIKIASALQDENGNIIGIVEDFRDISMIKAAEQKLKEREASLRDAQRIANIGNWYLDLATGKVNMSDQMLDIVGVDDPSVIGDLQLQEKLYTPESWQQFNKVFDGILKDGKSVETVLELAKKNNNCRFVLSTGEAVFDDKQKIIALKGTLQDVTERIESKHRLEESEKKFRTLYNNAPLAFQSLNEVGEITDINPMWLTMLDYKRNEVIGKWFGDFLHPDFVERFKKAFATFKLSGCVSDVQFKVRKRNGTYIYVSVEGGVGYTPTGAFKQTYCVFQDITKRKKAEENLLIAKEEAEKNEANVKAIIEGTKNSIWAFDTNYNILYINPKFRDDFLQSFGVLLTPGMNLLESLPLSIQPLWKSRYDKVLNDEYYNLEDAVPTEKGTLYIEVYFNPIIKNGKVIGASCFGQDITKRRREELELKKAKEKAEEADRLKSAFLANMSHEIRTPMNGILGFTELLKKPNLSGEAKEKYIDIIKKSGDRMLDTVNDIIDISKIDAGQVELLKSEVNLCHEIASQFDFFKEEAKAKGLDMRMTSESTLPILFSDKNKLNSIISNLIKNAIKYTDSGSIEINCVKQTNTIIFSVTDTGIGIPEHRIASIFNRFEQADISDVHAKQGSGLGLAITKAYVEMLGGSISVESEEGVGSCFYFRLPLSMDETKIEAQANAKKDAKKEAINIKHMNVLIAEDDEVSYEHLEITLEHIVKRIDRVDNGLAAVEYLECHPDTDLVLMDLKMPQMNGWKATEAIRSFNKVVVIIAQTAYALEGDKEDAFAAGCNDYISKPIDKQKLLNLLKKYQPKR